MSYSCSSPSFLSLSHICTFKIERQISRKKVFVLSFKLWIKHIQLKFFMTVLSQCQLIKRHQSRNNFYFYSAKCSDKSQILWVDRLMTCLKVLLQKGQRYNNRSWYASQGWRSPKKKIICQKEMHEILKWQSSKQIKSHASIIFQYLSLNALAHDFTGKSRNSKNVFDHCTQKMVLCFFYNLLYIMASANAKPHILLLVLTISTTVESLFIVSSCWVAAPCSWDVQLSAMTGKAGLHLALLPLNSWAVHVSSETV